MFTLIRFAPALAVLSLALYLSPVLLAVAVLLALVALDRHLAEVELPKPRRSHV